MKVNGSLALCAVLVVAISASAARAFALGGSFDNPLAKTGSNAVEDDSFFPGQRLTLGNLKAPASYAESATRVSYSECASCAGDEQEATATFYDPGFAQGYVYDPYAPVVFYDYAFEYAGYDAWSPLRSVARLVDRVRPVRRILNGARNLVFGAAEFCRPAYVCDPCWTCDDICDPCAFPVACAPYSVYAPQACCGYGYYPGEINELDPETGLPKEKIAREPNLLKSNLSTDESNAVLDTTTNDAPKSLSSRVMNENAARNADAPAIPRYDSQQQDAVEPNNALEPNDALDSYNGLEEEVPTPAPIPNLGAGVIRMLVPEDAVVYVNGYRTKQTGELRAFAARQLELGETYSFEIRVVALRDGKVFEDVQTTTLTAGDSTSLAFNLKLRDSEVYAVNDVF